MIGTACALGRRHTQRAPYSEIAAIAEAERPEAYQRRKGIEGVLASSINLGVLKAVGAINVASAARTGCLGKVSIEQTPDEIISAKSS